MIIFVHWLGCSRCDGGKFVTICAPLWSFVTPCPDCRQVTTLWLEGSA